MPETIGAVGTFFATAGGASAGASAGLAVGTGAASATFAGIDAATVAGAAAAGVAAGGASGVLGSVGTGAATAAAGAATTRLLSPKPPGPAPLTQMPDPLAEEQAKQQSIVEQLARRGRASTILTQPPSGGSLGG